MNKNKLFALPYLIWLLILIGIPLILMIILTFLDINGLNFNEAKFSMDSYSKLLDSVYFNAIIKSLYYAIITTIICLLIGFPVAVFVHNLKSKYKNLVLILLILPMWTNMLLRIIAWEKTFLSKSLLNHIGLSLDFVPTNIAIIIVMVSMYLPFMIFPIFNSLEKIDNSLIEASNDLGANKLTTYLKIIIPLSLPGIISGSVMVLLPSLTSFAIPERISGGNELLIGNIIQTMFGTSNNYSFGSLLSLLILLLVFLFMLLPRLVTKKEVKYER